MRAFFRGFPPVTLLFLYIYPQNICGFTISTRIIMGIIGFLMLFRGYYPAILTPLKGCVWISIISIITAVYNRTYDFHFVWYIGSMLMILLAAYFFLYLFPRYAKNIDSINLILKLYVYAILIQSVAAVLMFMSPALGEILQKVFPIAADEKALEQTLGLRLLGLGSAFFGAGVTNGLSLIIIVYLYLRGEIQSIVIWVFYYFFIFFVGLMMARTTSVGLIVSIFFLIIWKPLCKKSISKKLKLIMYMALALIIVVNFIIIKANDDLLNFAFEFLYNYEKSGTFESASTNDMLTMYRWPEDLRTWLIGDGMFNTKNGYYMRTDIGFLRLLYYGGIPMILSYFYFSVYIIRKINKLGIDRLLRYFLVICFIYQIVLNAKGLVDLNYFFLLIYLCIYKIKQRIKEINVCLARQQLTSNIITSA